MPGPQETAAMLTPPEGRVACTGTANGLAGTKRPEAAAPKPEKRLWRGRWTVEASQETV